MSDKDHCDKKMLETYTIKNSAFRAWYEQYLEIKLQ